MAWLKIQEGETVHATIDFSSIKSVPKHWTGQRSELCLGEGCPHCLAGIPKRWRYQAQLLVDREPFSWEFGEQAMTQLNAIPHSTNWSRIIVTRLGSSRNTQYRIQDELSAYAPEAAILASDFLRRKYGHHSTEEEG